LKIIIIKLFFELIIRLFIPFDFIWAGWISFILPFILLSQTCIGIFIYLRLLQFIQWSRSFSEIQIFLTKNITSFAKAFQYSCIQLILGCNIWWNYISKRTFFKWFYITLSTIVFAYWRSECVYLVSIINVNRWMNNASFRIYLFLVLNIYHIAVKVLIVMDIVYLL